MLINKVKLAVLILVVAGLLVSGAGVWAWQALAAAQPARQPHTTLPQAGIPGQPKDAAHDAGKAVQVHTAKAVSGGLKRILAQPGTVHAFEQTDVYARVSGFLKNQKVDIGDHVKR